jgi:RNA polymerase sigma factor (sigma-70 family)
MNMLIQDMIVTELPRLRAFARMLAKNPTLADDLVQETALRALTYSDQYRAGTNFRAWVATILRNTYFNEMRHGKRLTDLGDRNLREPMMQGAQEGHVRMMEFQRALYRLPPSQREALVLVGASGFSYEEAAEIAGCAVGTMKSRVCRARAELKMLLDGEVVAPALKRAA